LDFQNQLLKKNWGNFIFIEDFIYTKSSDVKTAGVMNN
jgi:hypothetical protein